MFSEVSPYDGSRLRDPLEIMKLCRGYYKRPMNGPLVGYAGKDPATNKAYVGEIYVNFAMAERHAQVLRHFAETLLEKITNDDDLNVLLAQSTGFCGAPEGGKALACMLAQLAVGVGQYIYPEKEVTKAKSDTSREESKLVFSRHEPDKDDILWIVEDMCNNFSTTKKLVELIESYGARVAGILCFWNRSLKVDDVFQVRPDLSLPVVSVVRKKIPQYTQDDEFAKPFVDRGDVIWKPKNEWRKLEEAMLQAV